MAKQENIVKEAHESHAPVYDLGNRICRLRDQATQMIQMAETYQQEQASE